MEKTKAAREGYAKTPFFFAQQSNQGESRLVAWTSNLAQLKDLVYGVLGRFPEGVEILFKVEKSQGEDREWDRYHGNVQRQAAILAIKNNEMLVFQDGCVMLCIKRPDTGAYLVVDDDGIFFFYPDAEEVAQLCEQKGFERRQEELISGAGHWNVSPKGAKELRESFIKILDLKKVSR